MKKIARLICVMLSVAVCVTCVALVACAPKESGYANENTALVFSSGEFDNVFNPFFSSSVYDSEIVGQTQIGMINTDDFGGVFCGSDEPMVALNLKQSVTVEGETYPYDPNEEEVDIPTPPNPEQAKDSGDYYSTYEFLIKNNIKFADGKDLTIRDVIFNLYTYLDPTYYGSSTIYSTDIRGLNRYRTQQDDSKGSSTNDSFNASMQQNVSKIIKRIELYYSTDTEARARNRGNRTPTTDDVPTILGYLEKLRFLAYDEVVQLWNDADAQKESYEEQNEKAKTDETGKIAASTPGFTETWQIFLYDAGIIKIDWKADGTINTCNYDEHPTMKDINGQPIKRGAKLIDYSSCYNWFKDSDSLIKIVFNDRLGILNGDEIGGVVESEGKKPNCDIIIDSDTKKASSSTIKEKDENDYWNRLWTSTTMIANTMNMIYGSAAGNNFYDELLAQVKDDYFASTEMKFKTVEGIKVLQYKAGDTFEGQFGNTKITEDQYALQITVDGVDPKAIWNFGFTVAPMHYYSNADNDKNKEFTANDDYRSFNYPVCDKNGTQLATAVKTKNGDNIWDPNKAISMGRPFAKKNYMDNVIKSSKIINIPMGAGPYQPSSKNPTDESPEAAENPYHLPTFGEFLNDNIVYFIRNPYFHTTSGEGLDNEHSSICNPKIRYIRYQVINSTKLLNTILDKNGTVHFGDPNATDNNVKQVRLSDNADYKLVDNNGYGYIGINPTYVPDLNVRRAIMSAMNIQLVEAYYGEFSNPIYRPVSTVSWASPTDKDGNLSEIAEENPSDSGRPYNEQYYPYQVYEDKDLEKEMVGLKVEEYLSDAGYTDPDGKNGDLPWEKKFEDGTTHKLEYTFTIAGATDDHPAYSTMKNAADILNKHGFKIVIKNDSTALSKLAAGTLTVWAAAWGSAIDPDMYQVYHMDSSATSTKGWGYPTIISKYQSGVDSNVWAEQYAIIEELSDLIDEARNTLVQAERAKTYLKAYDKVMELAVELPLYQRKNLYVYRTDIIDESTINNEPTVYNGVISKIWELKLLDK